MDIFTLVGIFYCLYILIWFVLACIADCDVVTYLSTLFGKSPGRSDWNSLNKHQHQKNLFTAREFAGKVVWVTGASSGIGEALAKKLAKCNARLAISARRKDELIRVKQECLGLMFFHITASSLL